jgi:hypothetical protein
MHTQIKANAAKTQVRTYLLKRTRAQSLTLSLSPHPHTHRFNAEMGPWTLLRPHLHLALRFNLCFLPTCHCCRGNRTEWRRGGRFKLGVALFRRTRASSSL